MDIHQTVVGENTKKRAIGRCGRHELVAHVWPHDDPSYRDIKQSIAPVTYEHSGFGNFMRSSFVVLKLQQHRHPGCDATEDVTSCEECRNSYHERFIRHWSIVVSMLDFTCGFQHAGAIKNEYTSGSDIYHALGAARTGIVGAWYVSLGYLAFVADPVLSVWLLGVPFISVLAFVQYKVLSSARRQAFDNLVARVAAGWRGSPGPTGRPGNSEHLQQVWREQLKRLRLRD